VEYAVQEAIQTVTYRIGWFSTGRGQGSRNLLRTVYENVQAGSLRTEISFVFSNRDPGEALGSDQFLALVRSYGIPVVSLSSRKFLPDKKRESREEWRLRYDREIMKRLEGFAQDICVLAGYMLVVGPEMCERYNMINLHPAAPGGPAGTWQEVIWRLIETEAESTGVMMHLVTPELDKGPTVAYCTFSIRGEPFDTHWREVKDRNIQDIKSREGENNALFRMIRQHGFARELPLMIATIRAFSEGVIRIAGRAVVDQRGARIDGYDLTPDIENVLQRQN
jgi:phosphoribosylglycinamide formyltransferase-1